MSYSLTIEPLGRTIEVNDGQTILDAALREGIYLPHACCHGLCATCKVQITDGEVDHGQASNFALMDYEREEQKCLACCATLQSDVVIEADIDEDPDALNLPIDDFDGVVERIENLTPTIKGVWIRLDKPMQFQAGQYVNLTVGELDARAFSLANSPSTGDLIELNIKQVPGGQITGYVHNDLKVGEHVKVVGPYGRFFTRKSAQLPLIFMAGGSGLSSPKSMIAELLEDDCTLPITLVYGARTRDELYDHDLFVQWTQKYPNFTYVPALSAVEEGDAWNGFRGFVHDAAKTQFDNDFRGHKAYLCGPPL
ncbi:MAG: 2Fe-2S iron-sulfur cluster binding domain-containing protein, partial [Burkholderiaceae bacterium]